MDSQATPACYRGAQRDGGDRRAAPQLRPWMNEWAEESQQCEHPRSDWVFWTVGKSGSPYQAEQGLKSSTSGVRRVWKASHLRNKTRGTTVGRVSTRLPTGRWSNRSKSTRKLTRAGSFRQAIRESGWVLGYAVPRRSNDRSRQLGFMPTGDSGPETAGAEGRNVGHRLPGPAGRGFRSHRRAPRSGGASISRRAGRGPAVPPPEEAGQSRG